MAGIVNGMTGKCLRLRRRLMRAIYNRHRVLNRRVKNKSKLSKEYPSNDSPGECLSGILRILHRLQLSLVLVHGIPTGTGDLGPRMALRFFDQPIKARIF